MLKVFVFQCWNVCNQEKATRIPVDIRMSYQSKISHLKVLNELLESLVSSHHCWFLLQNLSLCSPRISSPHEDINFKFQTKPLKLFITANLWSETLVDEGVERLEKRGG